MSRPSKQIDLQLLASGMVLLPSTGCAGLSVRKLVEHAGVNLGMFHYHFKNKDNFITILLEQLYEEMFSDLQLRTEAGASADAPACLRAAVGVLGSFALRHRAMLVMLASEAARGEPLPLAFLRKNLPRHVHVIAALLAKGQAEGSIVAVPVPQLLPFIAGAIVGPVLAGGAAERSGQLSTGFAALLEDALLSEQALAQRIDLALRAITLGNERSLR